MAGLYRVRCDIHGVLEERRGVSAWASAYATYDEAKAAHNRFGGSDRHSENCKIDVEVSDHSGLTWTEAPL